MCVALACAHAWLGGLWGLPELLRGLSELSQSLSELYKVLQSTHF